MIYEHFRRKNHQEFVDCRAAALAYVTEAPGIYSYSTSNAFFLLAAQDAHLANTEQANVELQAKWGKRFSIKRHASSSEVLRIVSEVYESVWQDWYSVLTAAIKATLQITMPDSTACYNHSKNRLLSKKCN